MHCVYHGASRGGEGQYRHNIESYDLRWHRHLLMALGNQVGEDAAPSLRKTDPKRATNVLTLDLILKRFGTLPWIMRFRVTLRLIPPQNEDDIACDI
jgi:hypothetical protein